MYMYLILSLSILPCLRQTVLYLPGLEKMALGVAEHMGDGTPVLCTDDLSGMSAEGRDETGLAWERFPSGDPDIKLRIDYIKDRHVILIMNHDTVHLFEQLAVILFLQRFNVPHALEHYANGKWKKTMQDGAYDSCSVASLTIVVPWYRHCQMERTSRWTVKPDGKWYNGKPDGEFVDVPTAQSFAAMLSALPIPGACAPPPQQLLLLDIHEYDDLEVTLNSTGRWANDRIPYDHVHGVGTYFASPFDRFLSTVLAPMLRDNLGSAYVVFPDGGAHRRFYTMVHTCIPGIPYANILWIEKSRVGASVTQSDGFKYIDASGTEHVKSSNFPADAFVLLADDFTNSGSTLFGGAEIIRRHADGKVRVHGYVTHYVAKYDRQTVTKFVAKLYGQDAPLDEFHCSDSIPNVIAWLKEEVKLRTENGEPQRAHVMQLAPLIGDWIVANNAKHLRSTQGTQAGGLGYQVDTSVAKLAAALAIGVGLGVAWARSS